MRDGLGAATWSLSVLTLVLGACAVDRGSTGSTETSLYFDPTESIVCHKPAGRSPYRLVVGPDDLLRHQAHGDVVITDTRELCEGMAIGDPITFNVGEGLPPEPQGLWTPFPVPMSVTLLGNVTKKKVAVLLLPDGVFHLNPWLWRLYYVLSGVAAGWHDIPADYEHYLTLADLLVAKTDNIVFAWGDFVNHPESVDICLDQPDLTCPGDPVPPLIAMFLDRVNVFSHSGSWDDPNTYHEQVPGTSRPSPWVETFTKLRDTTLGSLAREGLQVTHLALAGTSQTGDFTLRAAIYDTKREGRGLSPGSVPCFFAGSPENGAVPDFAILITAAEALAASGGIGGHLWIEWGIEEPIQHAIFDTPLGATLRQMRRVEDTPVDNVFCDDTDADCGHNNIDVIYLTAAAMVRSPACRVDSSHDDDDD
jgi:hypothetical protein